MNGIEKISRIGTSAFGVIVGSTSIFYALGFIITNLYFLSFGVRLFELKRAIYLPAGILFLSIHSIPLIVAYFIYISEKTIGSVKRILGNIVFTGSIFMILLEILTSDDVSFGHDSISYFIQLVIFIILLDLFVISNKEYKDLSSRYLESVQRANNEKVEEDKQHIDNLEERFDQHLKKQQFFAFVTILISLLGLIKAWSGNIYPYIDPAFGGGKPIVAELILADETASVKIIATGINVDENVAGPVDILDDTGTQLFLLIDGENVAVINRSLVSGIIYSPHR